MGYVRLAEAVADLPNHQKSKIYRNNLDMTFHILDYEGVNNTISEGTMELHEILTRTAPTRLFLDIDSKSPIDYEVIIQTAISILQQNNVQIDASGANIAGYETNKKYSSHIVFNAVAPNLASAKHFMRLVKYALPIEIAGAIDILSGASLRLIMTPKANDHERILYAMDGLEDDVIRFLIQPDDVSKFAEVDIYIPHETYNDDHYEIDKINNATIIEMIENRLPQFKYRNNNYFDRIKAGHCNACNINHKDANAVLFHNADDTYILYCIQNLANTDNPKPLYIEFGDKYIAPENELIISSKATEFNSRYLSLELFPADKSLMIQSPYNSGKTYLYKQLIKSMPEHKSVLIITPRKTLTNALIGDTNFTSYMDINGDLNINKTHRVIFQIDSINRIPSDTIFDLVIVDEITTLYSHIYNTDKLTTKKSQSLAGMQFLIKNAKRAIITDNNINDKLYSAFKILIPKIEFYRNTYKVWENLNVEIITNANFAHGVLFKQIETFITNNKALKDENKPYEKCSIAIHAARQAEALYNTLIKINPAIKLYTASGTLHCSDIEKVEDFKDVNKTWANVDCVIYTSCVSVGVSCELDEYTTNFAIFKPNNCGLLQSVQMLFRCRKTKNFIIGFAGSNPYISEWNKKRIFKYCTMKHNRHLINDNLRADRNFTIEQNTHEDPAQLEALVDKSFGAHLWLLATYERLQSRSSFLGYLIRELTNLGMHISVRKATKQSPMLEVCTEQAQHDYAEFALANIGTAIEANYSEDRQVEIYRTSEIKAGDHAIQLANTFEISVNDLTKERFIHDEFNIDRKYCLERFRHNIVDKEHNPLSLANEKTLFEIIHTLADIIKVDLYNDDEQTIDDTLIRAPDARMDGLIKTITGNYMVLFKSNHGKRTFDTYEKTKKVTTIISAISKPLDLIGYEIETKHKGHSKTTIYNLKLMFFNNQ